MFRGLRISLTEGQRSWMARHESSEEALSTTMISNSRSFVWATMLAMHGAVYSAEFQLTMIMERSMRLGKTDRWSTEDIRAPRVEFFGGFEQILHTVQPIVAALQFGSKELQIVPRVDREPGQEKAVIAGLGGADDRGDADLVAALLQHIHEPPHKAAIGFGKGIRVREGSHGATYCVFDSLSRAGEFVVQGALAQEAQIGVGDRVRADAYAVCVQLSHLVPGQAVGAVKRRSRVAGAAGDQEYGGRKPVPGQQRVGLAVEITVSVVEGDHDRALRVAFSARP